MPTKMTSLAIVVICLIFLCAGCSDDNDNNRPDDLRKNTDETLNASDSLAIEDCSATSGCEQSSEVTTIAPEIAELFSTLVTIPAGTFIMGSPETEPKREFNETEHSVTLTRSFEMLASEVTQKQYTTLMNDNNSVYQSCGENCPVESVSWFDAVAFTNRLSESFHLPPCFQMTKIICKNGNSDSDSDYCRGQGGIKNAELSLKNATSVYTCEGFRLPTEAEWEYAARAGTKTAFYNGEITSTDESADPNLDRIGWYKANANNQPHPVMQKESNPWGLYDMSGNLWEWVYDTCDFYDGDVSDPVASKTDSCRSVRGGAWIYEAHHARSARRFNFGPGSCVCNVGFRVVRTL